MHYTRAVLNPHRIAPPVAHTRNILDIGSRRELFVDGALIEKLSGSATQKLHRPTAKEVVEEGLELGQMQIRMMEKIEELTLYTLQQEKRIEQLTQRLSSIEEAEKENQSNHGVLR